MIKKNNKIKKRKKEKKDAICKQTRMPDDAMS